MDFVYSAGHALQNKECILTLKLFSIITLANVLPASHSFNSFSHFIYSEICQVNTLRGDDLAVANSNL